MDDGLDLLEAYGTLLVRVDVGEESQEWGNCEARGSWWGLHGIIASSLSDLLAQYTVVALRFHHNMQWPSCTC